MINLQDCVWKKGDGDSFAQHMFELETPFRTYHFYAITRDDMNEWKSAIELCSQEEFRPSTLSYDGKSYIEQAAPKTNNEETPHHHENHDSSNNNQPNDQNLSQNHFNLPSLDEVKKTSEFKTQPEPENNFTIDDLDETLTDEGNLPNLSNPQLSSGEMSSSESRYFKKFGLQPPEQVGKRDSVLFATGSMGGFSVGSYGSIGSVGSDNGKLPYTSASIEKNPNERPVPTMPKQQQPTPTKGNPPQNTRKPGETEPLVRKKRPPPPRDEGCSCQLL